MVISILTATKNRLDFLIKAYLSLTAQSYQDWEWIVINDFSNDNTTNYLIELAKHEPRLKWKTIPASGQPKCISIGLDLCQGDWIGFLDDDDYLHPLCLEKCVHAVKNTDIDFLYTNYFVDYSGKHLPGKKCSIDYSKERLLTDLMTFHFRFIKKQALFEVGGIDTSFPVAWDYDLCLRLSENHKIEKLKDYLYYYRIHPNQISNQNRIDQIYWSWHAMNNALKRRGLDSKFRLNITPKFKLEPIEL